MMRIGILVSILIIGVVMADRFVQPAWPPPWTGTDAQPAPPRTPMPTGRGVVDVDGGLVQIASQRDGIVRDVLVQEGQSVHRNDVLAVVDDRAAVIQLAIAQNQLVERRAMVKTSVVRLTTARREHDRLARLIPANAVSQKAFDDSESELRAATAELALHEAAVGTAMAQLRSAEYERDVRTVRAPSDGTIIRKLIRPGDGLSTLNVTPLFWFAPATQRIVRTEIDEAFAALVKPGHATTITLETAQEHIAARGRVLRVGLAYGPRRATTYEPRDRADVRVLEAIVAFDGDAPAVALGQRMIVRFLGNEASS